MIKRQTPSLLSELERIQSFDSMEGIERAEPSSPSKVFLHLPRGKLLYAIYPGVLVALTIALASSWLSLHYGAPVMLFALLFGMAFHFLHEEGRCVAGIEFASRTVLRVGIALLGARITADQLVGLGLGPILMVLIGVTTTIAFGWLLAKWLGLSRNFGILSGGSVAICGASAALAIASILPKHSEAERDTILTVVAVTTLSTLAMIVYPLIVSMLAMDNERAGIFLGGTIHDVAQVVGAGYMVSPLTGDVATYVKLLRVAMLLPVVFFMALFLARSAPSDAESRPPLLPLFLLGFAVLVGINSLGVIPQQLTEVMNDTSRWFLVTAIAALGMKTSFRDLLAVGWRPVGLMVFETAWIAALVLATVEWLL